MAETSHSMNSWTTKKAVGINFSTCEKSNIVWYKKTFRFRILSDGIAVSLQYEAPQKEFKPLDKEKNVRDYENGRIDREAGLDPGDKTWLAFVYRDVATGKEVRI